MILITLKRLKNVIVIISIIISYSLKSQKTAEVGSYDFNKTYSASRLQFDLAIMKDALLKTHPGLFWYLPQEQFEKEIQSIRDSLTGEKTEKQFYILLLPLIAQIKCGHTSIRISEKGQTFFEENLHAFPFKIKSIGTGIYIDKNWSSDTVIKRGHELISINGIKTSEIINEMLKYSWCDGSKNSAIIVWPEILFSWYLYLIYGPSETYNIVTSDLNNNHHASTIPKITLAQKRESENLRYPTTLSIKTLNYEQLANSKTGVLTISSFQEDGFKKFLKTTFKKIQKDSIDNLIIDVRYNHGGNGNDAILLYSYIALNKFRFYDHNEMVIKNPKDSIYKYGSGVESELFYKLRKKVGQTYYVRNFQDGGLARRAFKPNKIAFKKNVFVLTGHESFSATSEFCSVIQGYKRATFIGQETVGGCEGNTSGGEFELKLPNTGIRVNIPITRFITARNECIYGRGVLPDHEVEPRIKEFSNSIDSEMKFTLDLIKQDSAK